MSGYAAAGGAILGGIGGAMKKGPAFKLSALGEQAQGYAGASLGAYNTLAQAGPGASDVTAAVNASRGYANTLGNFASGGLNNMSQGNQLAAQQFAGQRTALEQTFQQQLQQANQSAALSGRGQNDPILRARLAQDQSRQSAQINANQSSAAVDLGRQYSTDQIGLLGQQVNTLQGLSQQAFGNQQNLFSMSNQTLQNERSFGMQQAQYEASRGGGFQGALNGIMAGAGAGLQAGQGIQAMQNQTNMTNAQISQMQGQGQDGAGGRTSMSSDYLNGGSNYGMPSRSVAAPMRSVAQVMPTAVAPQMMSNPASLGQNPFVASPQSNFSAPPYQAPNSGPMTGWFSGGNSVFGNLFGSSGGTAYGNGYSSAYIGK